MSDDPDYSKKDDDVVIYDEERPSSSKSKNIEEKEESSEKSEESEEKEKSIEEEESEEKENEEESEEESNKEDGSEEESDKEEEKSGEEEEKSEDEEDLPFAPKQLDDVYDDIADQIAKKVTKKRSKKIDDEDLEKLSHTEKKRASKLKKIAKQVQKKLEEEEPDIVKILSTPMTEKDRKRMIQYYEIYKNTIENTFEHYDLRSRLINMLKNFSKAPNIAESEHIEQEIERIVATVPRTDVQGIKRRIIGLVTNDTIKARLLEMHRELEETPSDSAQYRNLKEKLEWGVSLPYGKMSSDEVPKSSAEFNQYCIDLRKKLDLEIYGMDEVKEEMIAMRINQLTKPGAKSTLALEGPPGVGKTAICEALAKAVGKPFERVALGGMRNPDILKGSENQYVGSAPSIILSFLRNMKVADGYVLFDEIDKLGDKEGQGVQDALLHITDYTQNQEFRDTFLSDFPHDISKICFLYGMNDRNKIDPILRDRLTIVEVEAYTSDQLKEIIKSYLLPRAIEKVGIPRIDIPGVPPLVSIDDSGCDAIITMLSSHIRETGVRKIDETIRKIVVRINLLRMITLPNGTTGKLKLKYQVPNFRLPFLINRDAVKCLFTPPKNKTPLYIT